MSIERQSPFNNTLNDEPEQRKVGREEKKSKKKDRSRSPFKNMFNKKEDKKSSRSQAKDAAGLSRKNSPKEEKIRPFG